MRTWCEKSKVDHGSVSHTNSPSIANQSHSFKELCCQTVEAQLEVNNTWLLFLEPSTPPAFHDRYPTSLFKTVMVPGSITNSRDGSTPVGTSKCWCKQC
eukprot:1154028-Pelagomonas_calceolata.AAC.14